VGTLANSRLCRHGTSNLLFLGLLEAPPGFEPGMEVLQGHPRFFFARSAIREIGPELNPSQTDAMISSSRPLCMASAEIGCRWFLADTVRAQLGNLPLQFSFLMMNRTPFSISSDPDRGRK